MDMVTKNFKKGRRSDKTIYSLRIKISFLLENAGLERSRGNLKSD